MFSRRPLVLDIGSHALRLLRPGGKGSSLTQTLNVAAVAIDKRGRQRVQEVGETALETPDPDLKRVWPVRRGVVAEPEILQEVLKHTLRRAFRRCFLVRYEPLVTLSAASSPADKRVLLETLAKAGLKRVRLLEDTEAAALTLPPTEGDPLRMLLLVGAEISTFAAVTGHTVKRSRSVPFAGNYLNGSIQRHLYSHHRFQASLGACERLKHDLGTLENAELERLWSGNLKDVRGGEQRVEVSAYELKLALERGFDPLMEELRWFLRFLPEEALRTLEREGIWVGGGTARLRGFADYVQRSLAIPVHSVPEPEGWLLRGGERELEERR